MVTVLGLQTSVLVIILMYPLSRTSWSLVVLMLPNVLMLLNFVPGTFHLLAICKSSYFTFLG